jgi:hypothetical protein
MATYYGEKKCEEMVKCKNTLCINKAYFTNGNKLLCGVHCKKYSNVVSLPKNPNKHIIYENKLKEMNIEVEKHADLNKTNNKLGNVIVSKMYMMKNPTYIEGYLNVFPNYKQQNRKDGFGCMRLSPKSLGPVNHNMPGLPPATTIENYHQFSKFWDFELDDNDNILEKYKIDRINAYTAPPMRHKYDKKTLLKYNNNINIPKFSMYYDKDGNEHRYNYLQCRYFYCHFYELLAKKEEDFIKLKNMIKNGYNLNIQGYDGYSITKDLMTHYNDTSKPFGHELVLYTLLVEDDTSKYPWNIFYEQHKTIYNNVISAALVADDAHVIQY